jgi:transcriptional regulator with XRE-family HTH domain
MDTRNEIREFLTSRRAKLKAADVGLPDYGTRRVPGLRREEIAGLAGVSPDYYTRLEQGRQASASPSVLDAVARALRLTAEERSHLYALARVAESRPVAAEASPVLAPGVRLVLGVLGDTPAVVCGRYLDVLAANDAARFLFADFGAMPVHERNAVRWMLLSPVARNLYGDEWESAASEMIGMLRLAAGHPPRTARLAEIVNELTARSPLFRRLWTEQRVSAWLHERKTLNHRDAGSLEFVNEAIIVHSAPEQTIYMMVPADAASFDAAFQRFRTGGRGADPRDRRT